MHLLSVNIGKEQTIQNGKKSGTTGIFKQPASGPVQITGLRLADDAICDTKNHGGPDQAVYVYGIPDYAWWEQELGYELEPGTFGENLTVTGLESAKLSIGDRLHIRAASEAAPPVILEVTSPRGPCSTLAARMGDPQFIKRFRAAGRPGVYCRVIQEGWVQAGDAVTVEAYPGETVTVIEMFYDSYDPVLNEAAIQRYLAAPIAIRARADKEEQLQRLSG